MPKERASEIGFCLDDDNANLVADLLVGRIRAAASEMEAQVNRLYRGRNAVEFRAAAQRDIGKTIRRLHDMAETLRDVQAAQGIVYLQAAE